MTREDALRLIGGVKLAKSGRQYAGQIWDIESEELASVILAVVAGPIGVGWELIESAPQDGKPVWVYVAMAHGLPPFEDKCSWHPDAGWCADELRPVTHWHPESTKMLRDAARFRDLLFAGEAWRNAANALSAEHRREKPQLLPRNREYTEAQLKLAALIDAEIAREKADSRNV